MVRSTSHAPAIWAESVFKRFGKTQALQGLDLQVHAGERVALLGPNGAGKTSLVRAICGLIRIDSGNLEVYGQTPSSLSARSKVGFIPQELAIFPDLTPLENLRFFGRFHGLTGSKLANRVQWALEWTGLVDRAHELVKGFSGGMKRRVNIACGCLHSPEILLLDEPTVGVDPQSRERIYDMLAELNEQGTALLWTTHLMSEAENNSDRIVVVDHGKAIAQGSMAQLAQSAFGYEKRVELRIAGNLQTPLEQLVWDPRADRWVGAISEVTMELAEIFHSVQAAGGQVIDVQVRPPKLDDIFLQLTGRELRE